MWTKYTILIATVLGMFRLITSSKRRRFSRRRYEPRGRNAFEAFMLEYATKQQTSELVSRTERSQDSQ